MILLLATMAFAYGGWAAIVTFDAKTDKGTVNVDRVSDGGQDSIVKDGVKIETPLGVLGNGSNYRIPQNGSVTVSTTVGNITNVEIHFAKKYNIKKKNFISNIGTCTLSEENMTWKGNGTSVIFSLQEGEEAKWFSSIVVIIDSKIPTTLSFDEKSVTVKDVQSFTSQTATLKAGETVHTDKAITYSSDNTDVVSVDGSTGAVEFKGYGQTTITASFEGDDNYGASSASYTINYLPSEAVEINEAKENTIEKKDNTAVSLIRTLSSEYWNTFCVPFDISETQIEKTFGSGTVITEFSGTVTGSAMVFNAVSVIKAGVPYLIKPAQTTVNPVFFDVAISETSAKNVTSDNRYSFNGVYSPTDIGTSTDGTNLFVTASGAVKTPSSNSSKLKGMRAYITVPTSANAKTVTIDLGSTTDIVRLQEIDNGRKPVYNMNGQRMSDGRLCKGLYIRGGKKFIVK